jgi:hypothetical protein
METFEINIVFQNKKETFYIDSSLTLFELKNLIKIKWNINKDIDLINYAKDLSKKNDLHTLNNLTINKSIFKVKIIN